MENLFYKLSDTKDLLVKRNANNYILIAEQTELINYKNTL